MILPTVQYMILCDDVLSDPQRPRKLMIVGLTTLVKWPEGETKPMMLEKLVASLILLDGHGEGKAKLVCVNDETGMPVWSTPETTVSFVGKNPSLPHAAKLTVLDCRFPTPGIYIVQFHLDGAVLARQTLIVREFHD